MLNRIVYFSLKRRGVVVALACLLAVYGAFVAWHAKMDVLPNFAPPQVVVQTEAPGLTPEQVETLVTRPLENTINGLGRMDSLRSESIPGLSVITAVFKEGTDIYTARQMLAERLVETAGELPAGVKTPTMSPLTSATMDLLKIGLVSTKLSPMELRTLADWTIKPRLLSVPGVARCMVFGGEVRQFQVQAEPDRMLAYGVSISEVLAATRAATGVQGAGFVETAAQRIEIQTDGQPPTPEALGLAVVAHHEGSTVRLKDVATVTLGPAPKFGDALVMGQPGVLLSTASQYGENTMEVTRAVEAAVEELKPLFAKEGIAFYPAMHRPATFIDASLKNIQHSLYLGAVLVSVVLLLFLGHIRTALISLTAIPLSLLSAVILLDKLGVTLNTITLGGLAIAIGEVVDDAIIDVENIFRRLRENAAAAAPRRPFDVVLDASLEVRTAVVYATFIVVLVFLPVLALTGLQGSFFSPLALSYVLAILASLVVALTLTPALSLWFFGKGGHAADEPWLQTRLKSAYARWLHASVHWPRATLAAVALLLALALARLPGLGGDFLPPFREGHFVLQIQAIPGTSVAEMMRLGGEISRELLKIPEIATVEQQVGRAEKGEDPFGSHRCEFHVELKPDQPGRVQARVMKDIGEVLDGMPGIQSEVVTFLGDRISETITGETAPVVVNVFGNDLDQLDDKAGDIARILAAVPGAKEVNVKSATGAPRLAVRLRPERLAQFGFRATAVLEAIQTAFEGSVAAQLCQGNQVTEVNVLLAPASRRDPESVGALLVKSPEGVLLPVRELAEVYLTTGRSSILHEGASRRQTITCRPEGRDVASFVAEAKRQVAAQAALPQGMFVVFGGAAEAVAQARAQLALNSAIAVAGILLLLVVVTRGWRNLMLILANLPFALVGGLLAVAFTGGGEEGGASLTIGSLVGFVTLFGITTRNSIMMISHYEHLVRQEGLAWNVATAVRGASERLVPILMTALVTAIGLLPLAMGSGEAGREIEGPMAQVILGGLVTSTGLNLLVLPALALRFGRFGVVVED